MSGVGLVGVEGVMSWTNGAWINPTPIADAAVNVTNSTDSDARGTVAVLDGGVLNIAEEPDKAVTQWDVQNGGGMVWTGGDWLCTSCTVTNEEDGEVQVSGGSRGFLAQSDDTWCRSAGTITVTVPDAVITDTIPFVNEGTGVVAVTQGTWRFAGPGESRGSYVVATAGVSVIEFTAPLHTLYTSSVCSGAGRFVVQAGEVDFYGTVNTVTDVATFELVHVDSVLDVFAPGVLNTTLDASAGLVRVNTVPVDVTHAYPVRDCDVSGTARVEVQENATAVLTRTGIVRDDATVDVTGDVDVGVDAEVDMNGGVIVGSGGVNVYGALDWRDGQFDNDEDVEGTLSVLEGGNMNVIETPDKLVTRWQWINAGHVLWQAGNMTWTWASMTNTETGEVNIDCDTLWLRNGSPSGTLLHNFGLVTTTMVGRLYQYVPFLNEEVGRVVVTAGHHVFRGFGESYGQYSVSTGATVQFDALEHVLHAPSRSVGTGVFCATYGNTRVYGYVETRGDAGQVLVTGNGAFVNVFAPAKLDAQVDVENGVLRFHDGDDHDYYVTHLSVTEPESDSTSVVIVDEGADVFLTNTTDLQAGNVTTNGRVTVQGEAVLNGTDMSGVGLVGVEGVMSWTNGAWINPTPIADAAVNVTNSTDSDARGTVAVLDGGVLNIAEEPDKAVTQWDVQNGGGMVWTGGDWLCTSCTVTNEEDGEVDVTGSDLDFVPFVDEAADAVVPLVTNRGNITVDVDEPAKMHAAFVNEGPGVVTVLGGEWQFHGPGESHGTYDVAQDQVMSFHAPEHVLHDDAEALGAGEYVVENGTVQAYNLFSTTPDAGVVRVTSVGALLNVRAPATLDTDVVVENGTAVFHPADDHNYTLRDSTLNHGQVTVLPGAGVLLGVSLTQNGGTLTQDGLVTTLANSTVELVSGLVTGSGTTELGGDLYWRRSRLRNLLTEEGLLAEEDDRGLFVVSDGGRLFIVEEHEKELSGFTLYNAAGLVEWSDGNITCTACHVSVGASALLHVVGGPLSLRNGSLATRNASLPLVLTNKGEIAYDSGAQFDLLVTYGESEGAFLNVNNGTWRFDAYGESSGMYTVQEPARVQFDGYLHELRESAEVNGAGLVDVTNGLVRSAALFEQDRSGTDVRVVSHSAELRLLPAARVLSDVWVRAGLVFAEGPEGSSPVPLNSIMVVEEGEFAVGVGARVLVNDLVHVESGEWNVYGALDAPGAAQAQVRGGESQVAENATATFSQLFLLSGNMTVDGLVEVLPSGVMQSAGSTVLGGGVIDIYGTATWTDGDWFSHERDGLVRVLPAALFNISAESELAEPVEREAKVVLEDEFLLLSGWTVQNFGHLYWDSGSLVCDGCVVNNTADGRAYFQSPDGSLVQGDGGSVGTVVNDGGLLTLDGVVVDVVLVARNDGTVVTLGGVSVVGSGTCESGTVMVSNSSNTNFDVQQFVIAGACTVESYGVVEFGPSNTAMRVAGTLLLHGGELVMSNGTVSFEPTASVSNLNAPIKVQGGLVTFGPLGAGDDPEFQFVLTRLEIVCGEVHFNSSTYVSEQLVLQDCGEFHVVQGGDPLVIGNLVNCNSDECDVFAWDGNATHTGPVQLPHGLCNAGVCECDDKWFGHECDLICLGIQSCNECTNRPECGWCGGSANCLHFNHTADKCRDFRVGRGSCEQCSDLETVLPGDLFVRSPLSPEKPDVKWYHNWTTGEVDFHVRLPYLTENQTYVIDFGEWNEDERQIDEPMPCENRVASTFAHLPFQEYWWAAANAEQRDALNSRYFVTYPPANIWSLEAESCGRVHYDTSMRARGLMDCLEPNITRHENWTRSSWVNRLDYELTPFLDFSGALHVTVVRPESLPYRRENGYHVDRRDRFPFFFGYNLYARVGEVAWDHETEFAARVTEEIVTPDHRLQVRLATRFNQTMLTWRLRHTNGEPMLPVVVTPELNLVDAGESATWLLTTESVDADFVGLYQFELDFFDCSREEIVCGKLFNLTAAMPYAETATIDVWVSDVYNEPVREEYSGGTWMSTFNETGFSKVKRSFSRDDPVFVSVSTNQTLLGDLHDGERPLPVPLPMKQVCVDQGRVAIVDAWVCVPKDPLQPIMYDPERNLTGCSGDNSTGTLHLQNVDPASLQQLVRNRVALKGDAASGVKLLRPCQSGLPMESAGLTFTAGYLTERSHVYYVHVKVAVTTESGGSRVVREHHQLTKYYMRWEDPLDAAEDELPEFVGPLAAAFVAVCFLGGAVRAVHSYRNLAQWQWWDGEKWVMFDRPTRKQLEEGYASCWMVVKLDRGFYAKHDGFRVVIEDAVLKRTMSKMTIQEAGGTKALDSSDDEVDAFVEGGTSAGTGGLPISSSGPQLAASTSGTRLGDLETRKNMYLENTATGHRAKVRRIGEKVERKTPPTIGDLNAAARADRPQRAAILSSSSLSAVNLFALNAGDTSNGTTGGGTARDGGTATGGTATLPPSSSMPGGEGEGFDPLGNQYNVEFKHRSDPRLTRLVRDESVQHMVGHIAGLPVNEISSDEEDVSSSGSDAELDDVNLTMGTLGLSASTADVTQLHGVAETYASLDREEQQAAKEEQEAATAGNPIRLQEALQDDSEEDEDSEDEADARLDDLIRQRQTIRGPLQRTESDASLARLAQDYDALKAGGDAGSAVTPGGEGEAGIHDEDFVTSTGDEYLTQSAATMLGLGQEEWTAGGPDQDEVAEQLQSVSDAYASSGSDGGGAGAAAAAHDDDDVQEDDDDFDFGDTTAANPFADDFDQDFFGSAGDGGDDLEEI